MSPLLAWALTILLIALGIVGAVVPGMPGPLLIFVAGLLHWLLLPGIVSPWTLVLLAVLAALSLIADWAFAAAGAKAFGGSRWGLAGASLGSLLGLPFGLAGLLAGAVLGGAAAEALGAGRSAPRALKAGLGAGLGVLAGTLGRLALALAMAALLTANFLMR